MSTPLTWKALPRALKQQVDDLVREDRRLEAMKLLVDTSPSVDGRLLVAQDLVGERYRLLENEIRRQPDLPQDLDSIVSRAEALPGPIIDVEVVWDGDTHGWFLLLIVRHGRPVQTSTVARFRDPAGDIRLFNRQVPPWPEAQEAGEVGQLVAARLEVPFRFESPDEPITQDW